MAKKAVLFAVKAVFLGLVIVFLLRPHWLGVPETFFRGVSLREIWESLKAIDPVQAAIWLTFATAAQLFAIVGGILRWRLLLLGQGLVIPFWYLAKTWFMGRAIGLFLPSTVGLDGYKFVSASLYTGEVEKCAAVSAIEKFIAIVALPILVLLTLPLGARMFDINWASVGAVMAVLCAVIVTFLLVLLNPRVVQVFVSVLPMPVRLQERADKLGLALTAYSRQRGKLLGAVLFGLWNYLGICLVYFGTTMAVIGDSTVFLDTLFASPLIIVGSIVAPTVSGLGVREAVFSVALGEKYGASEMLISGHLGMWAGEWFPFFFSIPFLLFTTRPSREQFLADVARMREKAGHPDHHAIALDGDAVRRYRANLLRAVVAGLFAGLVGGAVFGLGEAAWHLSGMSAFGEATAYAWAPIAYSICFVGLGLGVAAGWVFVFLIADRFPKGGAMAGLFTGTVLAVAAVVIGGFRLRRDVLGEQALGMDDYGKLLAAALGVFLLATAVAVIGQRLLKLRMAGGVAAGLALTAFIWAVGFGAARGAAPAIEAPAFAPDRRASGPNIVFIAVDTLRADYLQAYNAAASAKTPHIDALAADSVLFEKAFAQSSWTKASFGTIFSGMYPEGHTATGKASALPDSVTTFAETLASGGYYTKGYSNNPNIVGAFNYDQGFVDYVDLRPSLYFGAQPSCEKLVIYDILRKVVQKGNALLGGRITITDFYQPAETITDTGLAWLDGPDRPDSAPFMLFLHYMDPHDPFRDPDRPGKGYARAQTPNPDPSMKDAFIRSYVYEIEYLDEHLGRLIGGLKERGLYDDTLIVFTSDHGEEFCEHGGFWHGLSLYEEQIAIPLMLKLPGNQNGGKRNPGLARHLDIAPTIASFAGLQPDGQWNGINLFDANLNPGNGDTAYVYAHLDFEGIVLRAVRDTEYKLIESNEGNKRNYPAAALYDLMTDPGEQTNLAESPEQSERVSALRAIAEGMVRFIKEGAAAPVVDTDAMESQRELLESTGYL